jgi:hypothetical protein
MSNFPLYDTLNCDIPSVDLSNKEKEIFLKQVKLLDADGMERVYAIIRIHQFENSEDKSSYIIPYKGRYVKTDIKFNLDDLPIDLRHMLFKFLTIHRKMMIENSILHKEYEEQAEALKPVVEEQSGIQIYTAEGENVVSKTEDTIRKVVKQKKPRATRKSKKETNQSTTTLE